MISTTTRLYKATATCALAATAVLGLGATASAAPAASTSGAVSTGATSAAAGSAVELPAGIARAASAPVAGTSQTTAQLLGRGAAIKAIIKAIKSIPGLWKKAVDAVKRGYAAFKKWWDNSVPTWVKRLFTGVTIVEIYNAIRAEL